MAHVEFSSKKVDCGLASDNVVIVKHGENRRLELNLANLCSIDIGEGQAKPTATKFFAGTLGKKMSIETFCERYIEPKKIRDWIENRLTEEGYSSTITLTYLSVEELQEMEFKKGHIRTLMEAIKEWSEEGQK
ncbi:hypothetical protein C8J56DRAFT_943674 [Mycena floridula]|nr:hypothetical protein C8J56DRAFT_943674 [Mycena floridula]